MSRVQAQGAVLNGLNLPGRARLQQSDFQGAMLFRAYLSGANLWSTVFETANLDTVNFKGANLQFANLNNADLQKACLREAKLDNAIFNAKTNLDKVDFRGATGLNLDAIKKAKNYQNAIYDKQVSLQLGLPVKNVADNVSEGCLVAPRTKNWWIQF
ncbi:pentapeptide repeat-containing protein [Nostoc piscinale]|uniref:pentapeptide repeat-containing protein n=1 Tax=Nostoc piscinale TaxID=224012 RepID=UPI0007855B4F|nr:pentapeptide repeat-containing protein [Nostoc piscinale]